MGCNCGGKRIPQTQPSNATNGANQQLIRQIQEQQAQQAAIAKVVQQSVNPAKTLIKTYR